MKDLRLVVALILLVVLGCAPPTPKTSTGVQSQQIASPTPTPEPIAVQAERLWADYKANAVAADDRYKGKLLKVSGAVETIGSDDYEGQYVLFSVRQGYGMTGVKCEFVGDNVAALARLKKGQQVTMTGTCDGYFAYVTLKDCRLQ